MKIKTFEFLISDIYGNGDALSEQHAKYRANDKYIPKENGGYYVKPTSAADVDKKINKFLDGKDVVDIKVSQYTSMHHNNARNDMIVERFTIIYNEAE